MSWYDRHILPWLIDIACGLPMVQDKRRALVPQARGRVLEIGMGTGRNLPFYDRNQVSQLVGVDPALQMHRLAQRRSLKAGMDVELVGLSAERLPLPDDSFDTVVAPTRCAVSPTRPLPCTRCAACSSPVDSSCFVNMAVRPTRLWPAGRTFCSPCGCRWPEAAIWTGMCHCCCVMRV